MLRTLLSVAWLACFSAVAAEQPTADPFQTLQRKAFDYFWQEANPATGLVKDRAGNFEPDSYTVASIAATGFGLAALPIGVEHGWIGRLAAQDRALLTLSFVRDRLHHEHGWLYHFIDWRNGERVWRCEISSIDTALFLAGALLAGEYFGGQVRALSDELYRRVDFQWMLTDGGAKPNEKLIGHGWKPESGFLTHRWNNYSEHLILNLLALGSPTQPIPSDCWDSWERQTGEYKGHKAFACAPLFTHQYSQAFVDFRGKRDRQGFDYHESSVQKTKADRQFCIDQSAAFETYSSNVWGLSACDVPGGGYTAYGAPPGEPVHDGTVAPWVTAASLPFAPDLVEPAVAHMRQRFGNRLWGRYGFSNGFNLDRNWFAKDVIGIDLGAALLLIENHRTGKVWNWFMRSPAIQKAMARAGFEMSGTPPLAMDAGAVREVIVTNDFRVPEGTNAMRLIVRASHITIEGQGATLAGPGEVGNASSLEKAGIGILIEGASNITLKNVRVRGFGTGLVLRDAQGISVSGCDFSDNYHNPAHGWGELPPRGGIVCERARWCVFRENKAERVWNGMRLFESDENLVERNDFSHCSNTAISLWKASRNRFLENDLSYAIRIDRAKGEVHARDSTGVLIETGSNDNYWFRNDITHGGDGIFIRPLNRWVSRGNVFVENDTSHANNNCVESWSPGNVFIRNKANHGSYGFWLGGSDHTVLIGNEAAYNGLTNGNHNAPEPGFQHGGIVIVAGSSSHTVIDGNHVHHNNGAGIAFRGDVASRGRAWRTEHWIVQRNRIADNRFGIWGRWGDAITLAGNVFTNNAEGNYLTNVTNLRELPEASGVATAPSAELRGPEFATVGDLVRFDASGSRSVGEGSLRFQWWLDGAAGEGAILERRFDRPGFYRVGLTVDHGALAAMAWRDLLVTAPVEHELGTEGQAGDWGFELEGDNGKGRVLFDDDAGLVGKRSLRIRPNPYPGQYATAVYPAKRDANWDFAAKKEMRFWIKVENPNLPGFQNAGPVVRLIGANGELEYRPAKGANLLNDPPFSEARWLWAPVTIPLAGDGKWEIKRTGDATLQAIRAISISVDSWGWEPFTVWIDGLAVE